MSVQHPDTNQSNSLKCLKIPRVVAESCEEVKRCMKVLFGVVEVHNIRTAFLKLGFIGSQRKDNKAKKLVIIGAIPRRLIYSLKAGPHMLEMKNWPPSMDPGNVDRHEA